jgi:hypothetical protein
MTDRENQRRLDRLAMQYLTSVEDGDFDRVEALWAEAEALPDLAAMLHGLNAEIAADRGSGARAAVADRIVDAIGRHMPSAEILRPDRPPLTAATVAEALRKNPPRGLTADDLRLNDALLRSGEALPAELGVGQVVAWGRRFGNAPEAYWRAFRAAALKLVMRVESAENHQMAARPTKPKPAEGAS